MLFIYVIRMLCLCDTSSYEHIEMGKFYACQMSALQEDCRCFFIRMNIVDNDCILTFVHTAVEHDYNLNLARSL